MGGWVLKDTRGLVAFLVANHLTLKQGTLENMELYSDAVNTVVEGFNTTGLTLVAPGNRVTISDGKFVNAAVKIVTAESVLIIDTYFVGDLNLQPSQKFLLSKIWDDPYSQNVASIDKKSLEKL